jgi:sugar phosphate isomerase/epimerase
MKLGANSVLFGGFDLETAFRQIALAGYDGIELSAIQGMSEHLVLDRWREIVPQALDLAQSHGLELLAIEQPSHDAALMEAAFQSAAALGIGIVNCGPGGKTGDEESFAQSISTLSRLAEKAADHGVTLCVKAHVGAAIHDTPTTLRLMEEIPSSALGIDMDPSHIYRAGENPVEALAAVIGRVRHVHIRDCRGRSPHGDLRQQGPGKPETQANGRGDIDLLGYVRVLHENGYGGPVDLEIIGAKDYALVQCSVIAAEARGHMQACLQACRAR